MLVTRRTILQLRAPTIKVAIRFLQSVVLREAYHAVSVFACIHSCSFHGCWLGLD